MKAKGAIYGISFPDDFLIELPEAIGEIMGISIDTEEIHRAKQYRGEVLANNVALFKKGDAANSFIIIAGNPDDWLCACFVKVDEQLKDEVKAAMLGWDNLGREEYGQKLATDLENELDDHDGYFFSFARRRGLDLQSLL